MGGFPPRRFEEYEGGEPGGVASEWRWMVETDGGSGGPALPEFAGGMGCEIARKRTQRGTAGPS